MFKCNYCNNKFMEPHTDFEYDEVCPVCGDDNIEKLHQCDCGAYVEEYIKTSNNEEVCPVCAFDFVKELVDSGKL